jgi:tetratricopeptide (TPR) repeat protein
MYSETNFLGRLFFSLLLLALVSPLVRAQVATLAEIKYKDDYDRIQAIMKVSDPVKRAGQMLAMYKERPDMDPKLLAYADNIFAKDLETLNKQENFVALKGLCERALKIRPRFGEVYLFQGVVLKHEGKMDEAMNDFARCYMIKNPLQTKAKQLLDIAFKAKNKGSLIGEEKLIKQAIQALK